MYADVDIELPDVTIPQEEQDSHSQRLLKVSDLWGKKFTPDQIKRARRAYYGAVSYVDDCIGKLLETLKECRLDEDTIIVFSGDHGDMLGERGLWYKMSYFEASVRVPMIINHPATFKPHHVTAPTSREPPRRIRHSFRRVLWRRHSRPNDDDPSWQVEIHHLPR